MQHTKHELQIYKYRLLETGQRQTMQNNKVTFDAPTHSTMDLDDFDGHTITSTLPQRHID